jgi:hypothetical protein
MTSDNRFAVLAKGRLWLATVVAAIAAATGAFQSEVSQGAPGSDSKTVVAGLHALSVHDQCTGDYAPQPDTCLHQQLLERSVVVGGKTGVVHDVTLRVQGIFEPTIVRVIDGNDRQIDNAEPGRPDRLQIIKGLSDTPLAGQMLRLEVIRVTAR